MLFAINSNDKLKFPLTEGERHYTIPLRLWHDAKAHTTRAHTHTHTRFLTLLLALIRSCNCLKITPGAKSKLQRIKTAAEKVFVLVQAILGGIEIQDWAMKQEAVEMVSTLNRICHGLIAYLVRAVHVYDCTVYVGVTRYSS